MVDLSELDAKRLRPLLEQITEAKYKQISPPSPTQNKYKCTRTKRQKQKHLDEYEIEQIVAGYTAGESVYELADRFICHRITISNYLKDRGVQMRRVPLDNEKIQEAIHLYESGLSLVKVGEIVGASSKTVRTRLLEQGIVIRSPHDWQRKS